MVRNSSVLKEAIPLDNETKVEEILNSTSRALLVLQEERLLENGFQPIIVHYLETLYF